MARSNLVPYAFFREEGKTMDFSETVVVYAIKVGRCSQLNEYMKLMSTKGQGHLLTLVQNSIFLNRFSSIITRPFEAKFCVEHPWDWGTKACSNGPGHMIKMATMPIYCKNLWKSSSLEPKGRWPWNLVCSIEYSSTTKFVQKIPLGWPWYSILQQGQIWSSMLCMGKS